MSPHLHQILAAIRADPGVTRPVLMARLEWSEARVRRALVILEDKGFVQKMEDPRGRQGNRGRVPFVYYLHPNPPKA